jgi:ATP-dependent Lhr-like helicase
VLAGRQEIGHTDPSVLTDDKPGPRRLLLAGRSWQVTFIDWQRRRAFVEPAEHGGVAKWSSIGLRGLSFHLVRAIRDVYLGENPPVALTRRALTQLAEIRVTQGAGTAHAGATVVHRDGERVHWWTWAGFRANATLAASIPDVVYPEQRPDDFNIRMRSDLTVEMWRTALAARRAQLPTLELPQVDERAARGLKFSDVLPDPEAIATVAARLADPVSARRVLEERVHFSIA